VTPLAVLLMARRDSLNSTLAAEDKLFNKAAWRLIPVLFICYFAAYLDRVNVGFAELQMKADLKFSDTVCPALCSTPTSSGRRLTYDFTCE
jgi:sugar phosphate permease